MSAKSQDQEKSPLLTTPVSIRPETQRPVNNLARFFSISAVREEIFARFLERGLMFCGIKSKKDLTFLADAFLVEEDDYYAVLAKKNGILLRQEEIAELKEVLIQFVVKHAENLDLTSLVLLQILSPAMANKIPFAIYGYPPINFREVFKKEEKAKGRTLTVLEGVSAYLKAIERQRNMLDLTSTAKHVRKTMADAEQFKALLKQVGYQGEYMPKEVWDRFEKNCRRLRYFQKSDFIFKSPSFVRAQKELLLLVLGIIAVFYLGKNFLTLPALLFVCQMMYQSYQKIYREIDSVPYGNAVDRDLRAFLIKNGVGTGAHVITRVADIKFSVRQSSAELPTPAPKLRESKMGSGGYVAGDKPKFSMDIGWVPTGYQEIPRAASIASLSQWFASPLSAEEKRKRRAKLRPKLIEEALKDQGVYPLVNSRGQQPTHSAISRELSLDGTFKARCDSLVKTGLIVPGERDQGHKLEKKGFYALKNLGKGGDGDLRLLGCPTKAEVEIMLEGVRETVTIDSLLLYTAKSDHAHQSDDIDRMAAERDGMDLTVAEPVSVQL